MRGAPGRDRLVAAMLSQKDSEQLDVLRQQIEDKYVGTDN